MKIAFPSFKISWGRIPQTAFKVGASDARLWPPPPSSQFKIRSVVPGYSEERESVFFPEKCLRGEATKQNTDTSEDSVRTEYKTYLTDSLEYR